MVHGVEYVRDGYFGSQINAIYDVSYMVVSCAGITLWAFLQIRIVNKTIVPE